MQPDLFAPLTPSALTVTDLTRYIREVPLSPRSECECDQEEFRNKLPSGRRKGTFVSSRKTCVLQANRKSFGLLR